jgi:hypothetical protein
MRKWVFGVCTALVCLVVMQTGVYRDFTLECENTWSTSGYREWFGFLKARHWKKPSALEGFIQENYPGELTNRWRRWHATPPANVFGQELYCGYRFPPENGKIVDQYITGVSDSEKKALYDFFRKADAEAAVNKVSNIFEKVFVEK